MNSALLALFIRSLREDSRLRFTYFSRATLVLLTLLFLATIKSELGWVNGPGLRFFEEVADIDLWFVFLAGVSYFASPICEEKEEQTLGLLRMTNLNPLSILLGKSTSRLCTAGLLFTAQFPFTLLAITLGGVTLRQIIAVYVAIGAFLIFVSGLALLASVICRRTGAAGVLTGVWLLLFISVGPVAGWIGGFPAGMGWLPRANGWALAFDFISRLARVMSPIIRVENVLSVGRRLPGSPFISAQFLSNIIMGLGCFFLAWLAFGKFCDDQRETATISFTRRSLRGWRIFRPGRAWRRALAWKEFYVTNGGKRWVVVKVALYGALLALLFFLRWYSMRRYGSSTGVLDFAPIAFLFSVICMVAELAFAAGTIFRNEHQGQTLSSLAMLPQGIRRVAYQKLLGVAPALGASGLYLVLSFPLFVASLRRDAANYSPTTLSDVVLGCAFYLSQVLFFLHLVAALSLRLKRGALPLAIGFEILLFVFAGWFFGGSIDKDSVVIFITLVTFVVVGLLHINTHRRLEELAGEE
jgi:hypothetical protein